MLTGLAWRGLVHSFMIIEIVEACTKSVPSSYDLLRVHVLDTFESTHLYINSFHD